MTNNQLNQKNNIRNVIIIVFSIACLLVCITVLFPQIRRMIMDFAEQVAQKKASTYESWLKALLSYAMGGILLILFFDYCTLTSSGRTLARKVKQEIYDCLSEINFKALIKPLVLMSVVYLLGFLTIIRANFTYLDDLSWAIGSSREWYDSSRYIIVFLSYFIQPEIRLTDISPIPQLIAVLILSCSSVLLVYILGKGKITTVRLLASIPLGLSPYFLECASYKFLACYMALAIFASFFPFLFITRKKAFLFVSVVSLLVMCMTYQAATGFYMMIVVILCFQYWNNGEKSYKEIISFLLTTALVFCFSLLFFKFFLMRPPYGDSDIMLHLPQLMSGILSNIKYYIITINNDFGIIWKICILLIFVLFISKSIYYSCRKKILSFLISISVIGISFILSYLLYLFLKEHFYAARYMFGFGVLLAIISIYTVSDYKKIAILTVFALNWCFFVFAFSYGNALADQARYADFRIGILLNDLSSLYPDANKEDLSIQFKNSIEFTPTIKNISKNNPVIEKLVPKRLGDSCWDYCYSLDYFKNMLFRNSNWRREYGDYNTLDLPEVLDSYYHTIKSDGKHVLVILKH